MLGNVQIQGGQIGSPGFWTHFQRYDAHDNLRRVPEPEANTRISKGVAAVAKGIAALAGHPQVTEAELQDVFRAAFDCLPEYRRKLLQVILLTGEDIESRAMPRTMRGRELEELCELGIITSSFEVTDKIAELLSVARLESDK